MRRAIATLAVIVGVVAAGLLGPKPAVAIAAHVTVWEDSYQRGDHWQFNHYHGGYNLGHFNNGLTDGICNSLANDINWNDCVSSYQFVLYAGDCARVTIDNNGNGGVVSSRKNLSGTDTFTIVSYTPNDSISSIQFGHVNQNSVCVWETDFV